MKSILMTAVCLLSYSGTIRLAEAADYYVGASGNDANSGLGTSAAWRTVSKVNSMRFSAGDRILFQGSATFPGQLYFGPGTGGTATSPITITSYGTGKAIIDAGTLSAGFFAWNTAGIDIDNVIFKASSFGLEVVRSAGILFYNDLAGNVQLPRIHINNVEVYGFGALSMGGVDSAGYPLRKGGEGISIGGWNGTSGFSDIRITNAVVHDNEGTGVALWGPEVVVLRNIYISNLDSYRNTGRTPSPASSEYSGGGLLLYNVSNALVDQSKFHDNGTNGNGASGLLIMESDHVTVQNSQAYHNRTAGNVDGNGFDVDGGTTDSVLQYNYSYGNDGAGYLFAQPSNIPPMARNTIRYNISENDGGKYWYGSIHFWNGGGGISDIEIYNNTIYSDPASGGTNYLMRFVDYPVTNLQVRNNIFATVPGASVLQVPTALTGSLFQYNNYWTRGASLGINWGGQTYDTVAGWSAASGQESIQPMSADPLFVSAGGSAAGYKLSSTSPLIDKGTTVTLPATFAYPAPTRDYFGTSVSITPSIGAVASAGSATATTTLTINQTAGDGGGCMSSLGFSTYNAPPTGGPGSVSLTVSAGCSWTASSNTGWAQVFPLSGTGSGTIQFTIFPNFSKHTRNANLIIGGQTLSVVQPGHPGTPDERFVNQVYFNFFGRVATPAEVSFQVTEGLGRGASRWDLAMTFFNSGEFNGGGRFVAGLYVGILDRGAEYGGWLFQRNALAGGAVGQKSLVGNFMSSAEYAAKFGYPTNTEFVRLLYRHILLREATQPEVDYQAGHLMNGTTRVQLATNFLNSGEFRVNSGARLTSFLLYAILLLRDGNASELSQRRSELTAGRPVADIVREVVTSAEFGDLLN